MAQTLAPLPTVDPVESGPRLLTIEEYDAIADTVLKGERLELIEGVIHTKMPQNDPHINAVAAVMAALQEAFGLGFHLRVQGPLKMGVSDAPEPDVAVLRGSWRDYDGRRPDPLTDVPLVVEVSDSSLVDDRTTKARLYAKHGLPEYWIVNLQGRTLEVRRLPQGGEYAETRVYREGESLTVGGGSVAVADLLPRAADVE